MSKDDPSRSRPQSNQFPLQPQSQQPQFIQTHNHTNISQIQPNDYPLIYHQTSADFSTNPTFHLISPQPHQIQQLVPNIILTSIPHQQTQHQHQHQIQDYHQIQHQLHNAHHQGIMITPHQQSLSTIQPQQQPHQQSQLQPQQQQQHQQQPSSQRQSQRPQQQQNNPPLHTSLRHSARLTGASEPRQRQANTHHSLRSQRDRTPHHQHHHTTHHHHSSPTLPSVQKSKKNRANNFRHNNDQVYIDPTKSEHSCHQCKQRKGIDEILIRCSMPFRAKRQANKPELFSNEACLKSFCLSCLHRSSLDAIPIELVPDQHDHRSLATVSNWICPVCLDLCTCTACCDKRRKRHPFLDQDVVVDKKAEYGTYTVRLIKFLRLLHRFGPDFFTSLNRDDTTKTFPGITIFSQSIKLDRNNPLDKIIFFSREQIALRPHPLEQPLIHVGFQIATVKVANKPGFILSESEKAKSFPMPQAALISLQSSSQGPSSQEESSQEESDYVPPQSQARKKISKTTTTTTTTTPMMIKPSSTNNIIHPQLIHRVSNSDTINITTDLNQQSIQLSTTNRSTRSKRYTNRSTSNLDPLQPSTTSTSTTILTQSTNTDLIMTTDSTIIYDDNDDLSTTAPNRRTRNTKGKSTTTTTDQLPIEIVQVDDDHTLTSTSQRQARRQVTNNANKRDHTNTNVSSPNQTQNSLQINNTQQQEKQQAQPQPQQQISSNMTNATSGFKYLDSSKSGSDGASQHDIEDITIVTDLIDNVTIPPGPAMTHGVSDDNKNNNKNNNSNKNNNNNNNNDLATTTSIRGMSASQSTTNLHSTSRLTSPTTLQSNKQQLSVDDSQTVTDHYGNCYLLNPQQQQQQQFQQLPSTSHQQQKQLVSPPVQQHQIVSPQSQSTIIQPILTSNQHTPTNPNTTIMNQSKVQQHQPSQQQQQQQLTSIPSQLQLLQQNETSQIQVLHPTQQLNQQQLNQQQQMFVPIQHQQYNSMDNVATMTNQFGQQVHYIIADPQQYHLNNNHHQFQSTSNHQRSFSQPLLLNNQPINTHTNTLFMNNGMNCLNNLSLPLSQLKSQQSIPIAPYPLTLQPTLQSPLNHNNNTISQNVMTTIPSTTTPNTFYANQLLPTNNLAQQPSQLSILNRPSTTTLNPTNSTSYSTAAPCQTNVQTALQFQPQQQPGLQFQSTSTLLSQNHNNGTIGITNPSQLQQIQQQQQQLQQHNLHGRQFL